MDLPADVDGYIKETIDESLGLPVSIQTLQLKLRSSEEAHRRLRDQHLLLVDKLRQKDQLIDRAKAEAIMNAVALKKFVEENQKLAAECAMLVNQCNKWKRECSLYDHDREALMDFGNEADERAKEAEARVLELEDVVAKLSEELHFYKHQKDEHEEIDSSFRSTDMEQNLLESILATLINENEFISGHTFLEANSGHKPCQKLLTMWNSLRPSTQKVLSLAAKAKTLQEDKEHLIINLNKAEEEVNFLFQENNLLYKENKRLLKQCHRDQNHDGSDGKYTNSGSAKRNKRKVSSKMSSPVEMKIDAKEDMDSMRQPLSPLHNSPECRMNKK